MEDNTLTIGEVAAAAGIATSAIRYYERAGILPRAERVSGQRRYGEGTIGQLRTIEVAKRAGFSLEEARTLLESGGPGAPAHAALRHLAERKLPEIDELIERAEAIRAWLSAATACRCQTLEECVLFDGPRQA